DGKPYLVNDKGERRLTGSYYTPDYVVEYIVEKTLSPLVEERKRALEDYLKEPNPSPEKALDTLLDIKVLDPAMGSGHFLVGAVDYLSERFAELITELKAEPVEEALAELRTQVEGQLKGYGLEVLRGELSDTNLLKRLIAKRCIYGVDLNPMAVELAKLSLWLDTFTVGVPLSFLDHHLRHGNSVLGVSKAEFLRWVAPIWRAKIEAQMEKATSKVHTLLNVRDLTLKEVDQSEGLYAEAEKALLPVRRALDAYAAGLFAPKPKRGETPHPFLEARRELLSLDLHDLADEFGVHGEGLREAIAFAGKRRFFHFEIAFPEVFERENPGFDAVIGNPPYVRRNHFKEDKPFLQKVYPKVYTGDADFYVYFFARGLGVLREGGRLGFISSRQFTRTVYGEGLRKLLSGHALLEVVDFGENPVFKEANTFPAIFLLQKAPPGYPIRFKAVSREEFADLLERVGRGERNPLASLVETGEALGPEAFDPKGWTLASGREALALRKIGENRILLGEYVGGKMYMGIITGFNKAFFIDEETRRRLIGEDPKSAELIKPLLVGDDVRHYYIRWPNDPKTQYLIFASPRAG
ncbi:MAG: Eco57I restriction-modification methylase domain-containing protein, partial [Thermaceae bacterium]